MSTLAFLKSVQNALTLPAPGNQIQLASLLTLDISNVHAAIQNDILDVSKYIVPKHSEKLTRLIFISII